MCGRTVTLKVRWSNFKTISRSKTLDHEVNTTAEIYEVAKAAFEKLDPERPRIRLLGVTVSGLATGPPKRQLELGQAEHAARLGRSLGRHRRHPGTASGTRR